MKKKKNDNRGSKVISYLALAYSDYIASRVLLTENILIQGAGLAATAVEKYFKAILALRGQKSSGHLTQAIFKSIENYKPNLYKNLNIDFLNFLRMAYELRYLDNKKSGFSIVVNKYRTLAELDRTIAKIDAGFKLSSENKKLKTPYQRAVETKDSKLFYENHVLLGIDKSIYFAQINKVQDTHVIGPESVITAIYETHIVRDEGSFLKEVILSDPQNPGKGTLSRG